MSDDITHRLDLACVASCQCITKTPNSTHHAIDCRYRVMQDAVSEIEQLRMRVVHRDQDYGHEQAMRLKLEAEIQRLRGEVAGYANAHVILVGERDAARRREVLKDQIIASKDRGLVELAEALQWCLDNAGIQGVDVYKTSIIDCRGNVVEVPQQFRAAISQALADS